MRGPAICRVLDHPVTGSLDDLVPADHRSWHLDTCLDLSFIRDWVRVANLDIGQPSINPVIFFTTQSDQRVLD